MGRLGKFCVPRSKSPAPAPQQEAPECNVYDKLLGSASIEESGQMTGRISHKTSPRMLVALTLTLTTMIPHFLVTSLGMRTRISPLKALSRHPSPRAASTRIRIAVMKHSKKLINHTNIWKLRVL